MLERLSIINERYNFLTEELTKPEVYNDFKKMKELNKEILSLEPICQLQFKNLLCEFKNYYCDRQNINYIV